MNNQIVLPQGYQWLARPRLLTFPAIAGDSECVVSATMDESKNVFVLCSQLRDNHGTSVTNSWGAGIGLESRIQEDIFGDARGQYRWHFFEHYRSSSEEGAPSLSTVKFRDDGTPEWTYLRLDDSEISLLLVAMAGAVAERGFSIQEGV